MRVLGTLANYLFVVGETPTSPRKKWKGRRKCIGKIKTKGLGVSENGRKKRTQ